MVGHALGGIGDLIKIPPIVADLALGYITWSMIRELGGGERGARIGAALVIVKPITWVDSVVWGQVDSVGVVVLLLAVRELWRDRPERAAILAALAAIIKPQLGILIPIVAIVVIRRAFWPRGGHGVADEQATRASMTGWERRTRGPLRVATSALAGLLTLLLLSPAVRRSPPGAADARPTVAAVRAVAARAAGAGGEGRGRVPVPHRQRVQPVGPGHPGHGRPPGQSRHCTRA